MWFSNNPHIEVINAPRDSPDINPFRNFWNELTLYWETVYPRTETMMENHLNERLEMLQPALFQTLYATMPRRMSEIIRNNGGPTRY